MGATGQVKIAWNGRHWRKIGINLLVSSTLKRISLLLKCWRLLAFFGHRAMGRREDVCMKRFTSYILGCNGWCSAFFQGGKSLLSSWGGRCTGPFRWSTNACRCRGHRAGYGSKWWKQLYRMDNAQCRTRQKSASMGISRFMATISVIPVRPDAGAR